MSPIQILIQFVVAMIATGCFAVLFCAPRREILFSGFNGGLGWIVYYLLNKQGVGLIISSLFATFLLTLFARVCAIIRKTPATTYLLPGIFPLVPGAGIYYTAYYLFTGNNSLSGAKGLETFEIAASIVFGIIFGFAIPQSILNRLFGKKKNTSECKS